MPDFTEAEALARLVAIQEAGLTGGEAGTPEFYAAEAAAGAHIPEYLLPGYEEPGPSETGLRMGPTGLEEFVNILPEIPTEVSYIPGGGGRVNIPEFIPSPTEMIPIGGLGVPISTGTQVTQYSSTAVVETGYRATQVEQGLWAAAGAGVLALLGSGFVKQAIAFLVSLFGKTWFKVILGLVGSGLLSTTILNQLDSGRKATKRKHKRYSIGSNPRLGTLIKVDRHCNKILARFVSAARHAGLIKVAGRTQYLPMRVQRMRLQRRH